MRPAAAGPSPPSSGRASAPTRRPRAPRSHPVGAARWARTAALAALVVLVSPAAATVARASGNIEPIPPLVTYTLDAKQDRKGVLITNTPYGYYTGRLFVSDRVTELFVTKSRVYTYDMITQDRGPEHFVQCGWIESVVLRKGTPAPASDTPCTEPRGLIERPSFGRGFNCAPSVCIDGAPTHLTAQCDDRAYYNRTFPSVVAPQATAAQAIPRMYDYAGRIDTSLPVYYRYTTVDNRAVVIRTRQYGWVFVEKSCIAGYPRGGTPKPLPLALAPPMIMGKARALELSVASATIRSGATVSAIALAVGELVTTL
jgi:hypothetical protein